MVIELDLSIHLYMSMIKTSVIMSMIKYDE